MKVSRKGRSYENGKALTIDLRRAILDEIVLRGGNTITGYFPGTFQAVAQKFRVARSTVRKIWRLYCDSFREDPLPKGGGNPSNLSQADLELIEVLKREKGSITLKEIYQELEVIGECGGNTSTSAICRAIKNRMPSGEAFSRKKITHIARERFTPENMIYSQLFIDYVSSKNPYKLKFFDEAGVKTPDVGTRNYGHAPVGQRCVEIIRKCESPNITLNLLTSLYDGVGYFNLLNGPTDTVKFLEFFYEASQNASPLTGRPILECGDIIIMDNLSCHHYEGGEVLEEFLNEQGIELLYTPIYSPDLNPAEQVFSKVKGALNFHLRPVVHYDLRIAVTEAIDTVTAHDVRGFYNHTSYIFV
jgi:transposase